MNVSVRSIVNVKSLDWYTCKVGPVKIQGWT